jgi:hypothetical protein
MTYANSGHVESLQAFFWEEVYETLCVESVPLRSEVCRNPKVSLKGFQLAF